MLKSSKDILTFILHFSSVLVQCFTSLGNVTSVTSQTENIEPLKRAYIMIMPKLLFETDFGSLPVTSKAPFPAL